jgi:hypothetical protein
MFTKIKLAYLVSGVSFLAIAFIGGRYLFWRQEAFAFLLVTYLVVIIGIRLDELSAKLNDIQAQLAELLEYHTRQ